MCSSDLGLIYVYDDPRNCSGTKYTGTVTLDGYADIVIYDVIDNAKAASRKIKARVDCTVKNSGSGSTEAGNYGVLGGVANVYMR